MINNAEDILNFEDMKADTIGLIEFQATVLKLANNMMENNFHPVDVASTMFDIALQIYRTNLSDEEYNTRVDYISRHRGRIEIFRQTLKQTTRTIQ